MEEKLRSIIQQSSFQVLDGTYVYAKVSGAANPGEHFMVSRDSEETTVVTRAENVPGLSLLERNKEDYKLIALNVSVPFYAVGFLATVSNALAEKGMNMLIVSTYSKDYVLVRAEQLEETGKALRELGFQEHD